ncbi:NeuD/PglB/VioB family sugar acetyltransferase [Rudaeicoccus suwonensis]|uniref:Sugar O-acyltransferase (Sialic acid O-acetyltransferase NeuD family) n=1 Tax=Rudaeicoccus suwonensis TaxID=657409 RepID=A0A561E8R4_9MICO|nr:NeuD/PglB/VioB family sugar acetyltransferase [Rudaeicoccus suwonensis]TWE12018.1 sugar O-acyltransferase (sialic acid O-acetyltransferase NeuD family) [Rudaeicoccus suwonensis]
MTTPLVVVGCGGFGREVCSIVAAINAVQPTFELLGVLDDAPSAASRDALERIGIQLLGDTDWLDGCAPEVHAVIAIGSPSVRRNLDARFAVRAWATIVHPDSTIGADVSLAPGVVVTPGSRVSTAITIGRHAHLDQNVTVGHDSSLGDYSRLNPQACVSGNVTIGSGATVGASATILQGRTIGARSVVGAGAVVVSDVEPDRTVKGVPAR